MKIVCFGDSNTYGYDPRSYFGGRYREDCRWVDILGCLSDSITFNAGQNGRELPRDGYEYKVYNELLFRDKPDLLIIMLGSNDILQGLSAKAAAARMGRFLHQLPFDGKRVLLVSPPVFTAGVWVYDDILIERSAALAEAYKNTAEDYGCHFVDATKWGIELGYDGVHFTENGHRSFAENIYKKIIDIKEKL